MWTEYRKQRKAELGDLLFSSIEMGYTDVSDCDAKRRCIRIVE